MPRRSRFYFVLFLLTCGLAGLTVQARAADSPALGAPDFKPSPERSVGWRGDGTGHFPGATPPISWGRDRDGAGYKTHGIVWAAPLPDRGISSPIVVGDRVFVTCDTADLVCIDKADGHILWIRSESGVRTALERR